MHDPHLRFQQLAELSAAFLRRREGAGDGEIPTVLRSLERSLAAEARRPQARNGDVPRRIATAMAQALHSQPHLAITYGEVEVGGAPVIDPPAPWLRGEPLVVTNEVVERALGLSRWESDDLRDEVDRRTGRDFKQIRALHWMWTHFGLPDASPWALFRVLFPGMSSRQPSAQLLRFGAQLYAIPEGAEAPSLASLFLPWLPQDAERCTPLTTFHSRAVDRALKRALSRSVGADDAEVDWLLDHMVTALPADRLRTFLTLDQWRARGPATLTGLGAPYPEARWLGSPPTRQELRWPSWLEAAGERLHVEDDPRLLFDALATERVQALMRQLYAGLLARLHPDHPAGPDLDTLDLDLLDVGHHLEVVLRPLVDWPRSPATHQEVAGALGLEPDLVADKLAELGEAWEQQARSVWLALPDADRPVTVHGVLVQHLVALFASLRQVASGPPDPRADHRGVLILFAGHYLAEARVERLWLTGLSDLRLAPGQTHPPPEDIVGTWFWPSWRAVLDALEEDADATVSY